MKYVMTLFSIKNPINCIKHLQKFMDRTQGKEGGQMKGYVQRMLEDVKHAHKTREEQLSQAAQMFKQQLTDTSRKLERCLVAYRCVEFDHKVYPL